MGKKIYKMILSGLPLLVSIIGFVFLFITCYNADAYSDERIISVRADIISISGILSGIIIAYLSSKVLQIRQEKINKLPDLKELTQKLHRFRKICHKLTHSNMWAPGMESLLGNTYEGLTYFDVNENKFVNSKISEQASQFIQDKTKSNTSYLYLQLKSFESDIFFDETVYSEFEVPKYYSITILEKWIKHECGSGLYYYFDHEYSTYKNSLKLHEVIEEYQEDIIQACLYIDKERYQNQVFDNKLLAKLGTQVTTDILPRLLRLQLYIEQPLPKIITYLYIVLLLLITFGVSLPILIKVYDLDIIFDIISLSTILGTSIYLITSFYNLLRTEVDV